MINAEMAGRKAKKVEGNEGEVDGAKEEDASVKGRGAAAPSTAVAASAGRSGSVPPASLSVGPASRPRPAAPSRIPRQPPPLRPSSPSPSITPSIIPSPSPSSSSPSPPSRPFSSTLPTPSSSPAPKKTYKRAPAQYVSPTLAQARQKQRAERAESVAKSGHMTSITPEQELLKEKDKASLRQRFMTNVLRGAAVVFVPFAAQVPAVGRSSSLRMPLISGAVRVGRVGNGLAEATWCGPKKLKLMYRLWRCIGRRAWYSPWRRTRFSTRWMRGVRR